MLKIVKNDTNIEEFKKNKYLMYTEDFGTPMYAKIRFEPLVAYIVAKFK